LRVWRYFLVSVADLNVFHERYSDLKKMITLHAVYFGSEDLAHYITILFSKGIATPNEAFASMFVDRGGDDKFSDEKILGEFCRKKNWKEFGRTQQFDLALMGMQELVKQDNGWFEHYLSYMNEKLNRQKRGYKNVYSLKFYSETHYKAGLFNFLRWEPIKNKLPFPKGHSLKGKYPIFDWRSTGGNPLSYYFYEFNILKVIIKNHIRESLGLPLVGETKLNETRVYKLIQKAFPGFTVIREHSPPFLSPQRYDYYVSKLKVAVEWNGEQHYRPIEYFGGTAGFEATLKRDARKRAVSTRNGIRLIELKYDMTDDDILYLLKSLRKK